MEYKVESSLERFEAWSGGKSTLETLIEKGDVDTVESMLEDVWCDKIPTDTEINDFLWFDTDTIAEWLGYRDWDAYVEGWSESDLEDAEEWWINAPECVRKEVSGIEDEDKQDEWWDDLDDRKKVEIYYQND